MFCPSCFEPNAAGDETCQTCGNHLPDRSRVYIGEQFVLLNATEREPLAARLDDGPPQRFTGPALISRHRHAVALGDAQGAPAERRGMLRRSHPMRYFPLPDLPRLEAPTLDLCAVVTERRVYRPDDEAHIFIVAPGHTGAQVELEVRLSDQTISREPVTLNAGGTALLPYADLEEGEYTLLVRRDGQREPAECRFSVAEFTLSPLVATLQAHRYVQGTLHVELDIRQLSVAYSGAAEAGLQCAACDDRVVETKQLQVEDGLAAAEFDLRRHEGPFKLQITTPNGETALVDLPGSGAETREALLINPLGRVAEASLLPGEDTEPVRGLHVGYGGANATPLRLEQAVARQARFVAANDLHAVQIVAHDPFRNVSRVQNWRDVRRGDKLTMDVQPPYSVFTVGVVPPGSGREKTDKAGLYESWTAVIHPHELEGGLDAPAQARPGDQIRVSVSATPAPDQPSTVYCLLLAYDARLEHESPLPKLGRRQYQALRSASARLGNGMVADATHFAPPPLLYRSMGMFPSLGPTAVLAAMDPRMSRPVTPASMTPDTSATAAKQSLDMEVEVTAPPLLIPPSREDFPELAYLELFAFEGQAERIIPLGDQIGAWRCRAYLISGLDLLELTADVQADKPLYAELDLPAIVCEGDEIEASLTYHTEKPAEMVITLPDGSTLQGMVIGHGRERFRLTGPGDVSVQLSGEAGQDWTTRSVKPPGVQTVTASRLELLRTGQTARGERIVVYPGMDLVLTDTIEALLRYPFG